MERNVGKDEHGLIRTRERKPLEYLLWGLVCEVIVVVWMLFQQDFSWGRLLMMTIFVVVITLGWYIMERISRKQEENLIKEIQEKQKGSGSVRRK